MSGLRATDLLREAVEAARAALRDLDPPQIPTRMRRIVASSQRTLPVPLAESVLRELGENEFLRSKALEAWPDSVSGRGSPEASRAFLERADGWESVVLAEALAWAGVRATEDAAATVSDLDRSRAEVAELRELVRRERDGAEAERRASREALEEHRAPGRAARQAEGRLRDQWDAERSSWLEREQLLEHRIAELDREVRRLQEAARRDRKERAELEAGLSEQAAGGLPTDLVELARHLDQIVALVQSAAPVPEGPSVGAVPAGPYRIDQSVRPDTPGAVDALVADPPRRIVIDGYNLGFQMAERDPVRARALVQEVAGRLRRAASPAEVVLVFDSEGADEGSREGGRVAGVGVVFALEASADDVIVKRVAGDPGGTVVVTSDRELQARVSEYGVAVVWSEALVGWSRRH